MLKWDAFSPSGIMRAAYERSKQVVQSVTKNWSGYGKFGTIGEKSVGTTCIPPGACSKQRVGMIFPPWTTVKDREENVRLNLGMFPYMPL